MRNFFRTACSRRIVLNALRIALLVGSVLNLVNQGGAIISGTGISWLHLVLNYAVPYCVASYSTARNQMTQRDHE